MKKLMLLIGMLVAGNILFAQEHPPREREEIKLEKVKERLKLTDDQVKDWKEMKEKYNPELKEIRGDQTKNKADKMRAAADLMERQEEELATILSENQFAELQIMREEGKKKRQERKGNKRKGKG